MDQAGLSRRAVLVGAGVLAVAACSSGTEPEPPKPDPDAPIRALAADGVRGLVALYDAVSRAHPNLRAELAPLAAETAAHLSALEPPASGPTRSSGASTSPSATASPPVAVPATAAAARTALVRCRAARGRAPGHPARRPRRPLWPVCLRRSARVRRRTPGCCGRCLMAAPPERAAHLDRRTSTAVRTRGRARGDLRLRRRGSAPARCRSRQGRAAYDEHRSRRDQLQQLLVERKATPVAAAAAYRLPRPVETAADAGRSPPSWRRRLAAVWVDAVADLAGRASRACRAGAAGRRRTGGGLARRKRALPRAQRAGTLSGPSQVVATAARITRTGGSDSPLDLSAQDAQRAARGGCHCSSQAANSSAGRARLIQKP